MTEQQPAQAGSQETTDAPALPGQRRASHELDEKPRRDHRNKLTKVVQALGLVVTMLKLTKEIVSFIWDQF